MSCSPVILNQIHYFNIIPQNPAAVYVELRFRGIYRDSGEFFVVAENKRNEDQTVR